jgi:hypothetical protein
MADETERSPLLRHDGSSTNKNPEATAEESKMADTAVGERLKYNDYTTIDWLHDLVHSHIYFVDSQELYSLTCAGQRLEPDALYPQSQRHAVSLPGPVR